MNDEQTHNQTGDLNVQLTYWPFFTANRVDFVSSLTSLLVAKENNLVSNVMPEFRNDSAAGPSGASSLESLETCYWNYGTGECGQ